MSGFPALPLTANERFWRPDHSFGIPSSLIEDPLPGPKTVALRSLGHVGDGSVVPELKASLHDRNDAVRATAAGALLHVLGPVKRAAGATLQPVDMAQ